MTSKYCPECGSLNPSQAKFCMECGTGLTPATTANQSQVPVAQAPGSSGTDWTGLAAGFLAGLSARRMSKKARNTLTLVAFLALFFGCPMACGTIALIVESATRLLGGA